MNLQMRPLTFLAVTLLIWSAQVLAQPQLPMRLKSSQLVLKKPPYHQPLRTIDPLERFNLLSENWKSMCEPIFADCTAQLWREAPAGQTSLSVTSVRTCASSLEPICQLTLVCPEDGFMDAGPDNMFLSQFAEYLFFCENDTITLRLTSRFPAGPEVINGQPSYPFIVIDGQTTQIALYEPTCQMGIPVISGCLVPTTSDGTQFQKICVDPQQFPQGVQQACSGDWYIETPDGRCWNLPCQFRLDWEGTYLATEYGCQVSFGEPQEIPCNPECQWNERECGCEGCQPACEDLQPSCLSEVPMPELP